LVDVKLGPRAIPRSRGEFTPRLFHASVKQMKQVKQDFELTI